MHFEQPVCFARGFSYRREAFGGILYHYEGTAPDPRVTFVQSRFVIDLLDAVHANPRHSLRALIDGVTARLGLSAAQTEQVEAFFAALLERGALVPAQPAEPAPAAEHDA